MTKTRLQTWSPERQVLFHLIDQSSDVEMPLHQAVAFLQSFGEKAEIRTLEGRRLVSSLEADVVLQAWKNYAPSA